MALQFHLRKPHRFSAYTISSGDSMKSVSALVGASDSYQTLPDVSFDGAFQAFARSGNPRITLNNNGEVFINGTHAHNTANVTSLNASTVRIELVGIDVRDFSIADVDSIRFLGRKGNDNLNNLTAIPVTGFGNEGNDNLFSGSGNDTLIGGPGDDVLRGRDGNDILRGEQGNDTLFGDNDRDQISGGNGNDSIFAGSGNDFATGDAGDDFLNGGPGDDVLHGWTGNDTLVGEAGNDYILGWVGDDKLNGGTGNDQLFGDRGRDELIGNSGLDRLDGGNDRDLLFGSVNSAGPDQIVGGLGADHILYFDADTVVDSDSTDLRIRLKNGNSNWTLPELRTINRGLDQVHDATGNNELVKDYIVGEDLLLQKFSALPGGAAAINRMTYRTVNGITTYDRVIQFADWDENNAPSDDLRVLAFIHELAHNFDNDFELAANPNVSPALFESFIALSNWRGNQLNSNYVQSQDGQWWYHNASQFYRSYSTTNPSEDWATIWEMFFDPNAQQPPPTSNLGRKLASVTSFINRFK